MIRSYVSNYANQGLTGVRANIQNPIARGLAHYWPLTDGPPPVALATNTTHKYSDLVAPAASLTYANASQRLQWRIGQRGGHLFTATSGADTLLYLSGEAGSVDYRNWTLSGWANPTDYTNIANIICKSNASNLGNFCMRIEGSTGKLTGYCTVAGSFKLATSAASVPTAKWNHCLVTFDGTTIRTYLNGKADGTIATGGACDVDNIVISIGCGNAGASQFYKGGLQNLLIWKRALQPWEVRQMYQHPWQLLSLDAIDRNRSRIKPPAVAAAGARKPVGAVYLGGTGADGTFSNVVAGEYNVSLNDSFVTINNGVTTVNLPTAASFGSGRFVTIKQLGPSRANIVATGGGTIDGLPFYLLGTRLQAVRFHSDGANYFTS